MRNSQSGVGNEEQKCKYLKTKSEDLKTQSLQHTHTHAQHTHTHVYTLYLLEVGFSEFPLSQYKKGNI